MTMENTAEAIEEKIEDSIEDGVEKIIDAQEKMATIFDTMSQRGLKVSEEWVKAVSGTQKDFLTLYKDIAKEPRSYGKNIEAWMGSLTDVQKRSLDFAKVVYQEQTEAAEEMKEVFDPYFASSKQFSESAKSWMNMWAKPFQSTSA
ncbi:MAG: hypothetical protein AAF387_12200 [Pseudomonadota bacterium]